MIFRILPALAFTAPFCFAAGGETPPNFATEKLVAWCIVPFGANKRSPAQRAVLLKGEFEEEIRKYQKHEIEFFVFRGGHETAYHLFQKYHCNS